MSYPTRTQAGTIGGRQRWQFRSLFDAMADAGFDPVADGSEWLLMANDIHFWTGDKEVRDLDQRVKAELLNLAAHPPVCVVVNGDILNNYVSAFGFGPYPSNGATEVAYSNAAMSAVSALAPLKVTTGNHDTGPYEDPVDTFMAANATWWTGANHTWTCGGVHCIALSSTHDASFRAREQTYFNNAIAAISGVGEVIIFAHQPSMGARVAETGIKDGFLTAVPGGFSNPMWYVAGHTHTYEHAVYTLAATTVVEWICSCTSSVVSSGDNTAPALSAFACRGGKVVARFSWNGKTGYWFLWAPPVRTGASALPGRLDGLGATPSLATYLEGKYSRTGKILTASNTTWRDTGSWMAYVTSIKVMFPIPSGATKFWVLMSGNPTAVSMSNTDSSYQSVTVPADALGVRLFDIPVGLRAGSNLYVTLTSSEATIGGWGFA